MAKTYIQQIVIRRRVENSEATKAEHLFSAMDDARALSLPDGYMVSGVDSWSLYINKDGEEDRHYDE